MVEECNADKHVIGIEILKLTTQKERTIGENDWKKHEAANIRRCEKPFLREKECDLQWNWYLKHTQNCAPETGFGKR